jgi:hypothetical protein
MKSWIPRRTKMIPPSIGASLFTVLFIVICPNNLKIQSQREKSQPFALIFTLAL